MKLAVAGASLAGRSDHNDGNPWKGTCMTRDGRLAFDECRDAAHGSSIILSGGRQGQSANLSTAPTPIELASR